MTQNNTWRIDSEINPTSYWHILITILWLISMLLVMLVANVTWWQWLIMVIIFAISIFIYRQQKLPIIHITQARLDNKDDKWLIFINNNNDKQCWQGDLINIQGGRYVLVLTFDIMQPFDRQLSLAIWRDQVDDNEWRKLQTLARLQYKTGV